MGRLLVDIEDKVLRELERVAPGPSEQRSEFVSQAIRKALWELEERATAEAYARKPDTADDAYVDPDVWEA